MVVITTGAVPAIKPEATSILAPQDGRWKITLSFDGRRFCVPKSRNLGIKQTVYWILVASIERLTKQTGKSRVHKITANYLVQIE